MCVFVCLCVCVCVCVVCVCTLLLAALKVSFMLPYKTHTYTLI